MKKREADFTIYFRHYLKANPFCSSAAFELKQTTTESIPFSDVKDHQINALLSVRQFGPGFLYKIPDDSIGVKPFDMCYLRLAESYVVIRYPKEFHFIGVETFLKEKEESKRKSLTCDRAREISIRSVKIK